MSQSFGIGKVPSRQAKVRSVPSLTPSDHVFEIPTKLIKTPTDMRIWEKSEAYYEYMGFILAINEAVKGKSNSQGRENPSESVVGVVGILDKLDALIDETPPIAQPQRFGNVAFRTWFKKMRDDSLNVFQGVIKSDFIKAIPEVASYLVDSFGNSTRIDYGTGHEISFIMFLCCLFKIGVLKDTDRVATGCYIFPKYLDLARKLQKTYRMEPAGSHGVWSLDDYQFVPFIWGSSQLVGHSTVEPQLFLQPKILKEFGQDYMFLTCIQYINDVKSGPFAEHSNQLWSISGVSSWSKINGGLIKMYKAEVLSKFPVVQHIVFGSLFTLRPVEQCPGMMTPKYPMGPPPSISAATSTTSSEEVSRSSRLSSETKSSSSKDSIPSVPRENFGGSVRDSAKGSERDATASLSSKDSEKSPSVGSDDSKSEERKSSSVHEEASSEAVSNALGKKDSGAASDSGSAGKEGEETAGDLRTDDKEETVKFSDMGNEQHVRTKLNVRPPIDLGRRE